MLSEQAKQDGSSHVGGQYSNGITVRQIFALAFAVADKPESTFDTKTLRMARAVCNADALLEELARDK